MGSASVQSPPPNPCGGDGPLCKEHREPMVLRELNGRRVYVCQRWPCNHCSSFCPLEVALVPLKPRWDVPAVTAPLAEPEPTEPDSPMAASPCGGKQPEDGEDDGVPAADRMTPSQELRTPRVPPAPSKSSSLDSRQREAPPAAQKSLVPIFAAFSPAAIRAAQLGASFVQLKAEARLVATMQQRAAVSPAAAGPASAQAARRTKRARVASEEPQRVARRGPLPPPARHPLQELTLGSEGQPQQQQQQQQRQPGRQPQGAAPALQPPSASASGTWLKSAARKLPRV